MKRLVLLLALSASTAAAQVAPPTCPHPRKASSHPSPAQIMATQAKATADPSVIALPDAVGNMSTLRYQVRDYADCTGDSGCYWADLQAQTDRARALLDDAARTAPKHAKLALVLDIDETSLSSYCEEIAEDFGYIPDRFETWITSNEAAIPIPGTVALARHAQKLGVSLFFITGRPEAQREATERNLHTAGYDGWKHLSLKQPTDAGRSTTDYKAAERAKIVAQGYQLVLNMGDQWSDLNGQPMAQHSVKLPNPFYYLP